MAKAQVEIGQRAYEEVLRIFEKMQDARVALGTSSKNHLYEWMNGVAPSAKYLQRLVSLLLEE